jgi:hypothetical protein
MRVLKLILTTIVSLIAAFGIVSIISLALGYRPIIDDGARPDWEAIGAIGAYAGVLVAIVIPFAVLYLEKKFENRINESEQRTQDKLDDVQDKTMSEITSLRQEYEKGCIWFCPQCKQETSHSGIMCTTCGYRDCD